MNDPLQYLLDRQEIRDLVAKYFSSADRRDFVRFVSCFVPGTGVDYSELLPVPSDCPIEQVAPIIEAAMAANYGATQHFMGNHEVTIDGDRAEGWTYCLAMHELLPGHADGDSKPASALRYLDRYVRTPEGWRIEHRRVTRDLAMSLPRRTGTAGASMR